MYELIRHNVGDNRSTTIEENIAEIKPITIGTDNTNFSNFWG